MPGPKWMNWDSDAADHQTIPFGAALASSPPIPLLNIMWSSRGYGLACTSMSGTTMLGSIRRSSRQQSKLQLVIQGKEWTRISMKLQSRPPLRITRPVLGQICLLAAHHQMQHRQHGNPWHDGDVGPWPPFEIEFEGAASSADTPSTQK